MAALLALLLPQLALSPAAAAGEEVFDPGGLATARWWGPEDDAGWHFRVPVAVHPRINLTHEGLEMAPYLPRLVNHPVEAELDLSKLLLTAGWLNDSMGGQPFLRSFTLDLDSFRVVEYTGFFGRDHHPIVNNPQREGPEHVREEVPYVLNTALFAQRTPRPFDAGTNPIVTLTWLAKDVHAPRFFYVYFDILENGRKPAPSYAGEEMERLDALSGATRANVFYGETYNANNFDRNRVVTVVALDANTRVRFYEYSTSPARPLLQPSREVVLGRGEAASYEVGATRASDGRFKVVADKPVVAYAAARGADSRGRPVDVGTFHPSEDGTLVGRSFLLYATSAQFMIVAPNAGEEARGTLYHVHPGGAEEEVARFRYEPLTPGSTFRTQFLRVNLAGHAGAVHGVLRYAADAGSAPVFLVSVGPGVFPAITPAGGVAGTSVFSVAKREGTFRLVSPVNEARVEVGNLDLAGGVLCGDQPVSPGLAATLGETLARAWDSSVGGCIYSHDTMALPVPVYFKTGSRSPSQRILATSTTTKMDAREQFVYQTVAGKARQEHVLVAKLTEQTGGHGRITIFAHHNETRVQLRHADENAFSSVLLDAGGYRVFEPLHGGYTVTSNKPVTVLWRMDRGGAFGGALGGRLVPAEAEIGAVEWGSYLVRLSAAKRSAFVAPGGETTFDLGVSAIGQRTSGRFLPDRIHLAVEGVPAGWTAEILPSDAVIENRVQNPQSGVLRVKAPPGNASDVPPAQVIVRATSLSNPRMSDSIQFIVAVSIHYEILLTFDTHGLRPDPIRQAGVRPGNATTYDLALVNLGDVADTARLEVVRSSDWNATLADADGNPVSTVALQPRESRILRLRVEAPTETVTLTDFTNVIATSTGNALAFSAVTAITTINPEFRIAFFLENATQYVDPGSTVEFPLVAVNAGEIEDQIDLQVQHVPLAGRYANWTVNLSGESLFAGRLSVKPGLPETVSLSVGVPEGAPALTIFQVTVHGISVNDPTQRATAEATVFVNPVHAIRATARQTQVNVTAEDRLARFDLTVRNAGNLDDVARMVVVEAPDGWNVTLPEPVPLAPGERESQALRVQPRADALAGVYNVTVGFLASSGPPWPLPLAVGIAPIREGSVQVDSLALEAGTQRSVPVRIVNTGNVPLLLALETNAVGWLQARLNASDARVPAFGEATLALTLSPLEGQQGTEEVLLRGVTEGGEAEITGTVRVAVARLDLRVGNLSISRIPTPGQDVLLRAVVSNPTPLLVEGVVARLIVDGVPLANVTIDVLPGGREVPVQFRWIAQAGLHELAIAAQAQGSAHELASNVATLQVDVRASLPGPEAAAAGLALAAAVAIRVRRSRG
ncbi:MAG TPA: hypothetical protein VM681_03155 [Candidatus Thermoplasmatota archaeon]|nr:hypothetical protein [Candidatus Thermoplasmatota archaeon]